MAVVVGPTVQLLLMSSTLLANSPWTPYANISSIRGFSLPLRVYGKFADVLQGNCSDSISRAQRRRLETWRTLFSCGSTDIYIPGMIIRHRTMIYATRASQYLVFFLECSSTLNNNDKKSIQA